jgi:hypothetical protein
MLPPVGGQHASIEQMLAMNRNFHLLAKNRISQAPIKIL